MSTRTNHLKRYFRILSVASAFVLLLAGQPALGQGMGRGGGGAGKPPPPPPKDPRGDDASKAAQGRVRGRILKFKPILDDADDEELVGILKIKPFRKNDKVLKLKVRRSDDLTITVNKQKMSIEEPADLLWKGLHCTAGWGVIDPEARRKVRELRSLTLDTIEVEGKITKIEDDMVIARVKPKNGQPWPGDDGRQRRSRSGSSKIRAKKLKMKLLEDVSKFWDADNEETDIGDFEVDQEVEVTVVFSRKYSMMVALRVPTEGGLFDDPGRGGRPRGGDSGGRGGPAPPGGRGGGRP